MEICFIADFFADRVLGGGELNNEEVILELIQRGHNVHKINSKTLTENDIIKYDHFIVANFNLLTEKNKQKLQNKKYVIYEHDHKYLRHRNPALYKNFQAPKNKIINYDFYKNANAVFCQSNFHTTIVKNNLNLENIYNLSGNLWDVDTLEYIRKLSKVERTPACVIMDSPVAHKNTKGAIKFCELKKYEYVLVGPCSHRKFLNELSSHSKFVFFPLTPETLSRVIVEARMLGLDVITNKYVGATKEHWFKLKGAPLIDYILSKRVEIVRTVEEKLQ
tara:strand:+ start:134 stop:964 length:831 start_codon:yes stop_codon:yes gene_type:complete